MREQPERLSTSDARQGTRTRLNLRVLIVSMAILIVLFTGLYMAFFGSVTPAP